MCQIFRYLFLLIILGTSGFAMEAKKGSKSLKFLYNRYKNIKKESPVLIPDTWQQVAILLEAKDFIHLALASKGIHVALTHPDILNSFANIINPFKFPIFDNQDKAYPFRKLMDICKFMSANEDQVIYGSMPENNIKYHRTKVGIARRLRGELSEEGRALVWDSYFIGTQRVDGFCSEIDLKDRKIISLTSNCLFPVQF